MPSAKKSAARKSRPSAKRRPQPKDIDAYIATLEEPARSRFVKVRAALRAAAPLAGETISYGIPALKQGKIVVWFAAFTEHWSLFPTAAVIGDFSEQLRGYTITKGSIHFPLNKPVPVTLVKKLVQARLARIAG